MKDECQTLLMKARSMLTEAKSLNENGQHGAAMNQAYHTSKYIAAAYLLNVAGQRMLQNDDTYDVFAKTIRESAQHPDMLQKIKETVGKVSALREVYEPALLDETTLKDAKQMIECVEALFNLVQNELV